MSSPFRPILHLLVAGFAFAASLTFSYRAEASAEFPGALQEAAGMSCTPSCTVCHGKTPGDAGSFTARKLSRDIIAKGLPLPHDTGKLKTSYAAYAADPANAVAVAALKDGTDPETGDSLCGPVYGCALQPVQRAPATDSTTGAFWVLGAVVAGGLLRRRRNGKA